ncbi:MAG: DUF1684 domain-containing protein [Acidimicrobiia bacterium]|nr:DUF1684 domain-containing protein [Acidimicrobiia bacterium]
MQPSIDEPGTTLDLWDYRRRMSDLYVRVRQMEPSAGWSHWVATRNELFRTHPRSPLPAPNRASFAGLEYWDYDPDLRLTAIVQPVPETEIHVSHSGAGSTPTRTFGRARFRLGSFDGTLTLYWLQDYGGGVFVPFGDATNGTETYGGGRYLLDTAKGADLGHDRESVTLDFNFSYHPSCVHDSRWSCPLSPTDNRLSIPIRAGERLRR